MEKSNILVYFDWLNPYTNKIEKISDYLPFDIIDKNIKTFLSTNYNIDIKSKEDFYKFLEDINAELSDLEYIEDFISLCLEDFLKSDYYTEACAEALDEYEMLNDLGEYEEESVLLSDDILDSDY